jgi:hypothetical protein
LCVIRLIAQTTKDLVGTWTYLSITLEQGGKKTDEFGPNPQGQVIFDPDGRFSLILTRSDVPRFASNNREAGTAEENQQLCGEALPISVRTRLPRQIKSSPFTLRAVRFQTTRAPIKNDLSNFPGTN